MEMIRTREQTLFTQIITIPAAEIADRSGRFDKYLKLT
jgi:hypothetical protein